MPSEFGDYQQHQGAWIHKNAQLDSNVVVEPGAHIGKNVQIESGTWIGSGAVIYGPCRIGRDNQIHAHAVLGGFPQDVGYAGEPTQLEIGHRNVIREGVTINRATTKAERLTRIGSDCFFMANSHVAHDCIIEDHVIAANNVLIAGHCHVQEYVNFAGGVATAQFCTIGRFSFLGAMGGARRDIEPFLGHDIQSGSPELTPICVNEVGLRRAGFGNDVVGNLRQAYKVLFLRKDKLLDFEEAKSKIQSRGAMCREVEELLAFLGRKRASRYGRQLTPK